MKKFMLFCLFAIILSGCSAGQEYETVMDVQPILTPADKGQIVLELPQEAILAVFENKSGERIYLCDDFEIAVMTLEGGDLTKTIQEITGFQKEKLTVMETQIGAIKCYECAWAAAGETERIGRLAIMDDGYYHYAVSAMADAAKAEEVRECWNELFRSFRLVSTVQ